MTTLITLQIEKIVTGAFGLARDAEGVILVEGALPGERVRVELKPARGVRYGLVQELLEPSPERVAAPKLPTADLAHADLRAQERFKRGFVAEALSRIAKYTHPVEATVPSPQAWQYRNSAQYLITPEGLAYRERQGHRPWLIQEDPLVMPSIQQLTRRLDHQLLQPAQELVLRASTLTDEVLVALIGEGEPSRYLRASDALLDAGASGVSLAAPSGRRFAGQVHLISAESELRERFGAVEVRLSATSFAQINPPAAALAYRAVAELAGQGDHAVDLYGGSGAIARHLAGQFRRVTVVDHSSEALSRGRRDVTEHGPSHISFRLGDPSLCAELSADVIVVDPPRAGLSPAARSHLQESTADRLVYLSCDPGTWARDVGELVRQGWHLGTVTPHDFYPQTSHIEVLSVLWR